MPQRERCYLSPAVDDFAQLPGCYPRTVLDLIAGYWISPLIIESEHNRYRHGAISGVYVFSGIFFLMVIWRAVNWWRADVPVPPTLVLLVSNVFLSLITSRRFLSPIFRRGIRQCTSWCELFARRREAPQLIKTSPFA